MSSILELIVLQANSTRYDRKYANSVMISIECTIIFTIIINYFFYVLFTLVVSEDATVIVDYVLRKVFNYYF